MQAWKEVSHALPAGGNVHFRQFGHSAAANLMPAALIMT